MAKQFGFVGQKFVADKCQAAFKDFAVSPSLFGKSCKLVEPTIETAFGDKPFVWVIFDDHDMKWAVPLICLSHPVVEEPYKPPELDPRIERHVPHEDD